MANIVRASAAYLREAAKTEQSAIANFGSVGSWHSSPAISHYCSTKWAVSGLTEGLIGELKSFGIDVTVIEPGYFRTEFLQADPTTGKERRIQASRTLDIYKGTPTDEVRRAMDAVNGKQPGNVVKAAKIIVDVLTKSGVASGKEVPMRLVLGSDCVEAIRKKMRETEALLQEWEAIARSTDY